MRVLRTLTAVGVALSMSPLTPALSIASQEMHAAPPVTRATDVAVTQAMRGAQPRVTLVVRDSSLAFVVQELTRQARLQLSYQSNLPAFTRRIHVNVVNMSVMDALSKVLDGTGMIARLSRSSSMVVIRPAPPAAEVAPVPTGIVEGRALDSATHASLRGVRVRILGTQLTAVTSDSGRFTLRGVPTGLQTVVANLLGFTPFRREVAVSENGRTPIIIVMVQTPTMLSGVVTTATGLQRRLAVGSDITTINVDSVMKIAPITSVTDLLESRVPGLTVVHTSGTPGDPSRLRLRGAASITGSNNPIVVVDGVRMYYPDDTRNQATAHNLTTGNPVYPSPSPLDQIDPNSIATIDVFKGPSASSLYGSDAANGVIVITTKRGHAGPTHWSFSTNAGTSYVPGKYPAITYALGHNLTGGATSFLQCTGAVGGVGQWWSSGGHPCVVDSLVTFQALNDARFSPLTRGGSSGLTASLSGGVQNLTYSFTASKSDERGMVKLPAAALAEYNKFAGVAPPSWMVHPDDYQSWSGGSQLAATINPKMRVVINSHLTSSNQQRSSLGLTGVASLIGQLVDTTRLGTSALLTGFVEQASSRHVTAMNSATFDWQTRPWMHVSVVGGINENTGTDRAYMPSGLPVQLRNAPSDSTGSYSIGRTQATVKTASVQASFAIPVGGNRRLNVATGFNVQDQSDGISRLSTTDVPLGVQDPSTFNPVTTTVGQSSAASSTYGWYIQPQFSLSSRFFISPGLRLDGGSASGTHASLTLFPKTDMSWVAIDNSGSGENGHKSTFQRFLTTLRLRGALGLAGVQPAPDARLRLLSQTSLVLDGTSGTPAIVPYSQGNTLLRPERSRGFETGFDADLLDSRITFTATYFNKRRLDAIVNVATAPSIGGGSGAGVLGTSPGIGSMSVNIGTVLNTGLEVTASAQILRSEAIDWLVRASATTNANKLVSRSSTMLSGSPGGVGSRLVEGYPIDGIWARPLVGYGDANHDNIIQQNEIVLGDSASVYIGTQNPRYTSTFGSTLALFNGRLAGDVNFAYQNGMTQYNALGLTELRAAANVPGATLDNQAILMATQVAAAMTTGGAPRYLYQTVNTLRLNSASLAYTVPASIASRLRAQSLSIAVQGSNLWLHTNYIGKDPNVNAYTQGEGVADYGSLPSPRVWSIRLSLTN